MLEIILIILNTVFLGQILVLFLQVLFALMPLRKSTQLGIRRPTIAVLIPAHNEAQLIVNTLQTVIPQLNESDRILVVADNCSDETAKLALSAGAEVIERHDLLNRGKGYALDYGMNYLTAAPKEVVIIIDADCNAGTGLLEILSKECIQHGRPIQALYKMCNPPNLETGFKAKIREFAWVVKNHVRPLGYFRIGLPCQLMGSGMAFPWDLLKQANLATGHIVEDLKLGLDFAKIGKAPVFCPDALVTSYFPSNETGVQSQRTRWEHGHLGLVVDESPKMILSGILKRDIQQIALALDLSVPPLALLIMLVMIGGGLSFISFLYTNAYGALIIAAINIIIIVTAILFAWFRFARSILSFSSLVFTIIYLLAKVPVYFKFLFSRQSEWVRSKRDEV